MIDKIVLRSVNSLTGFGTKELFKWGERPAAHKQENKFRWHSAPRHFRFPSFRPERRFFSPPPLADKY